MANNDAVLRADELAIHHARQAFAELRPDQTVAEGVSSIREQELDSAIVYFYVIDDDRQLRGIVPTRRLLTADPDTPIRALMTPASVVLPLTGTLRDAARMLVDHRLLAVPLVGRLGRIHGVIDAATLGVDVSAEMTHARQDELFQLLGTPAGGGQFVARALPLIWTGLGGLIGATVVAFHQDLIAQVAALTLFMPLLLALCESIAMQSVAVQLERGLTKGAGHRRSIVRSCIEEVRTAAPLAVLCAIVISGGAAIWDAHWPFVATLLISAAVAMAAAALIGTAVPLAIRRLRQNVAVAAGPAALALADVTSLVVYFRVATLLLA